MMNKILITGGTGFIGLHLTKYLLSKGSDVSVLVRKDSPNLAKLEGLNVTICFGDICDYDSIVHAFQGIDLVFHCAAYVSDWGKKVQYRNINIEGTKNVLEVCILHKVNRFVGLSTNDVFGRIEDRVIDETFPFLRWNEPYPDTKIEAEKLIWEYHNKYNLQVSISYPCWVYGPDDSTFLPHLIDAIKDGSFLYWRKGAFFYPTYVENLLDQLYTLAHNDAAIGNGYLVHDGDKVLLKEFCDKISNSMDLNKISTNLPYFVVYCIAMIMELIWSLLRLKNRPLLTTYVVKNFGGKNRYSQSKAKNELGWEPLVSFEEGFERTMKWQKANAKKNGVI